MSKTPNDMIAETIHKTNNCGNLVIKKYIDKKNVKVKFIKTGCQKIAMASRIRDGAVRDDMIISLCGVGFIGDGNHASTTKGKRSASYICWHSMIQRCYSEKLQLRQPTYNGCTVCAEWHNFQNFAEWYCANHPNDGSNYQLDKDIKIDGNKVYSPIGCSFVTGKENTEKASAKEYRMISPQKKAVTIYNMAKFCRGNNLNPGAMAQVNLGNCRSHKGWTKEWVI